MTLASATACSSALARRLMKQGIAIPIIFCVPYLQTLAVRYIRIFFFFQAEDGIRDLTVTGVQTCALPIRPLATVALPVSLDAMLAHRKNSKSKPGPALYALRALALALSENSAPAGRLIGKDRKSVV